eukprot:5106266-Alexandrium_andersonii.AAC.1
MSAQLGLIRCGGCAAMADSPPAQWRRPLHRGSRGPPSEPSPNGGPAIRESTPTERLGEPLRGAQQ